MAARDVLCRHDDDAPGKFCDLTHGRCHYLYDQPEAGTELVTNVSAVLVHGFVGSLLYFGDITNKLTSNGFKVLRLDLYGRGFSDSPARDVPMTTELFVDQLAELLELLGESRIHLFGYSMGGGIALSFAHRYPDSISSLCLVAPAAFPSMRKRLPKLLPCLLATPGVACFIRMAVTRAFRTRKIYGGAWVLDEADAEDRLKKLHEKELTRFPRERWSMGRSAVNTLRHFSWGEIGVGRSNYTGPVLVIWGDIDKTVPAAMEEASACLPQAKCTIVKGHGHCVPLEKANFTADEFSELMKITR